MTTNPEILNEADATEFPLLGLDEKMNLYTCDQEGELTLIGRIASESTWPQFPADALKVTYD